jgi:hypothetical protein
MKCLPLNRRYLSQLLELAPGTVASTRSARFGAAAIPIWLGGNATACRFLTSTVKTEVSRERGNLHKILQ